MAAVGADESDEIRNPDRQRYPFLSFSSVQNAEFESKLNKRPVLANEIAIGQFRNAST